MTLWPASFRHRVPLSFSVAAVATAVSMALALGLQTLDNLRDDQERQALRLGHAMANVLVQALRHDDVWLAYSLLRGPQGEPVQTVWILTDGSGRIFASNRPTRYRLDRPLAETLPELPPAPAAGSGGTYQVVLRQSVPDGMPWPALDPERPRRVLRLALESEGAAVGELVALLSDTPFLDRFAEILTGGLVVTLGVLTVLLPLGWLWGRSLAAPLVRLADCMRRVGAQGPITLECSMPTGDGELGQLGRRFAEMVAALARQRALEQQMLQSERLAAIGRVAAGVAHEINNPLGGMLMAIDTFRRRLQPAPAPRSDQLLDLLERGLRQIQSTVSALLIEARLDSRPLTPQDLEDVRTLTQPRLTASRAALTWSNGLAAPVALPATLVRQLLLNLTLNALEAVEPGGRVAVSVLAEDARLAIAVENSGEPIPPDRIERLFEPYPTQRQDRQGLGLWICYQIVAQLGGTIEVGTGTGATRLQVFLPLSEDLTDG